MTTEWVDGETADAVEFCFDERTLGVSLQLMNAPAVTTLGMLVLSTSGTGWHRDIVPIDMGPLDGLQEDLRINGPHYLQWNVPLYDDSFSAFHSGKPPAAEQCRGAQDRAPNGGRAVAGSDRGRSEGR